MHRYARGLSLIELMTTVAIIGILAAIALPTYNGHRRNAAENACLAEMKSYANVSIAIMRNGDTPSPASARACSAVDDATNSNENIRGTPRAPGIKATTCNMDSGICTLDD